MSRKPENDSAAARMRPTERSLPIALLRARETVMEPVREMLSHTGISEQKWRVLRVVEETGPVELTAIARSACLLLPSLTRIAHTLEKDGLITRAPDPGDRRKSIVSITDAGRALIAQHAEHSNQLFARLEDAFGRDKLDELLDLLDELQRLRL